MKTACDEKKRVALLGAGYISDHHLKALEAVPSATPVAVCDVRLDAAQAVQARAGLEFACDNVDELISRAAPDVVHILTPPPSHASLAARLLRAGIDVLIEKPVALDLQSVDELANAEIAGEARFGINHNATYYPAFQKLLQRVASGHIGPIQHVNVLVNTPMRQIAAKQFGHWMFAEPGNIVFESLYHPFSQLHALLGTLEHLHAEPQGYRQFTPELEFFDTWMINATFACATASLHYGFTSDNPVWRVTVMGQDGVAEADIFSGSFRMTGRSRHPWYVDTLWWNSRHAAGGLAHGVDAMAEFVLSTLKLKHGGEPFVRSNRDSLTAFYAALGDGSPLPVGLTEGREVVRCCEATRAQLPVTRLRPSPTPPLTPSSHPPVDALVLGASGFLGRHLIEKLLNDGATVRAMLRRPDLAPQWLRHERIQLLQGEINHSEALRAAMANVATVYHLAAAASDSWEATHRVIVEGTVRVGEACVDSGVKTLVYTSTIAACYLGERGTLTEQTPIDPKPEGRSHYARAKIESEHLLATFHGRGGLKVRVLRPGVVV
ncbi:MAG: NAD-dependent epimerase/dehydratase family protein, partial [Pseudomonadota bacterium]